MKKRMAAAAFAAALLAAVPVAPAQAQTAHCVPLLPDGLGCWIKCNVNYLVSGFPGPNGCTNG